MFFSVVVWDWEECEDAFPETALLVNTTSLGMTGQPKLDIDYFALPHDAVAYDIVYAPLKTEFLSECEERGNRIVTGLGMLGHQARKAFELWFGVLPDYDEALESMLLESLQEAA